MFFHAVDVMMSSSSWRDGMQWIDAVDGCTAEGFDDDQ